MSIKSTPISEYEYKDDQLEKPTKFKTIQKSNDVCERVFVKNVPAEKVLSAIKIGNILDRPQDVNWDIKSNHIQKINQNFQKNDYSPVSYAGSFCVDTGVFQITKEANEQVIIFPLDSLDKNKPVKKCEISGNMGCGTLVSGSVDASSWVGYLKI